MNITFYKQVVRAIQVTFRAVWCWLGALGSLLIYTVLIGVAGDSVSDDIVIRTPEYLQLSNTWL